jgi:uncharacterized protein YuzE
MVIRPDDNCRALVMKQPGMYVSTAGLVVACAYFSEPQHAGIFCSSTNGIAARTRTVVGRRADLGRSFRIEVDVDRTGKVCGLLCWDRKRV